MPTPSRSLVLAGAVALPLVGVAVVAWHVLQKPRARRPSTIVVEASPARLERGRYLVENVLGCFDCHAQSAVERLGFPPIPGTEGMGQVLPPDGSGAMLVAANLSGDPGTGLGRWTDGEILRALREGVSRDGRALSPVMPYESYRALSDEDAMAVVAHIRTLPPIDNALPRTALPLRLRFIVSSLPRPLEAPALGPDPTDTVARGEYLATISGCRECHTPRDEPMRPVADWAYTGGFAFDIAGGEVVSSNITPDPSTFVGSASRDAFIARFRAFGRFAPGSEPIMGAGLNSVMPWTRLGRMNGEDLGAIYDFLRTVPPSSRRIDTRPASLSAPTP